MKESRDILTLFEQLNSHEVFTPPRVARDMLALLPKEIWSNPNVKLLDPCVKSGVFLREALYLLIDGLAGKGKHIGHDGVEYDLNNGRQRMNHILKNMLFGIATSELTSYISRRTLYGVMEANTDKQTALIEAFERSKNNKEWTEDEKVNFLVRNHFNEYYDHGLFNTPEYEGFEHEGNIFYPCDDVKKQVDDSGSFEIEDTYYPFIEEQVNHTKIQQIKDGKMKFDVIIGNPPYQVNDAGNSSGASPIYHKFIEVARDIKPKYVSMIVPSRWFSGGKGLDSFRNSMLTNGKLAEVVDYQDSSECFPGVEIKGGVCFFLMSDLHKGLCRFTHVNGGKKTCKTRQLDEYDILVRSNEGVSILNKVAPHIKHAFSDIVSSRKPFGLPTNFKAGSSGSISLYTNKGTVDVAMDAIPKNKDLVGLRKVFLSKAYNGGEAFPHQIINKPISGNQSSACTETYLVIGAGSIGSKEEQDSCISYMKTKFFRFMVWLRKISQDNPKDRFDFVPLLDFNKNWSDDELYKKFALDKEEIDFIESMIKPME